MVKNKVFITSRTTGSTLKFVKDIFEVSNGKEFPQQLVNDRLKETDGDLTGLSIPYEIDNKYYTAKIDFWIDEIDPTNEEEAIRGYCDNNTELGSVVEAFVFIFDKNEPESFEVIKKWELFLNEIEPSIRLCIGTSSKRPLEKGLEEEINDWCLSNQFDYVDMDETTETPMDKVGTHLALDILQTHFWDGMVKKNEGGSVKKEDDLVSGLLEMKLRQEEDWEEGILDEEDDFPTEAEINEMQSELFGDIDGPDGLDQAFKAIQAMREQGLNMTDEERRKMAAKVALSFAAQLGI